MRILPAQLSASSQNCQVVPSFHQVEQQRVVTAELLVQVQCTLVEAVLLTQQQRLYAVGTTHGRARPRSHTQIPHTDPTHRPRMALLNPPVRTTPARLHSQHHLFFSVRPLRLSQ